jgi:hypothetical protein
MNVIRNHYKPIPLTLKIFNVLNRIPRMRVVTGSVHHYSYAEMMRETPWISFPSPEPWDRFRASYGRSDQIDLYAGMPEDGPIIPAKYLVKHDTRPNLS